MKTILIVGNILKAAVARMEEEARTMLEEEPHWRVKRRVRHEVQVGCTRFIAESAESPIGLMGLHPDRIITVREYLFPDRTLAIIEVLRAGIRSKQKDLHGQQNGAE